MSENESESYRLMCAVREGRLEKVKELISSFELSYSPDWSDGYRYVLLRDAIEKNHKEVAKLLITSGSRVNSKNKKPSDTPLHFAAINDDLEIVAMLLQKHAQISAKNKCGITPLHNAILHKKMEISELLLNLGADVNVRDSNSETPLHIASRRGCLQIVELLLKHGAYVNLGYSKYREGYTPLHLAAEYSEEIVKLLLSRGANVNATGTDGATPLLIATKEGHLQIVDHLIQQGACVNATYASIYNTAGYTSLHLAAEKGNVEIAKLLLDKGANVDAKGKDGATSLYLAANRRHEQIVKLLLECGANVDTQGKDDKTILHFTVERGYVVIVEDILKYHPDINNKSNRMSLKAAVLGYGQNNKGIIDSLLQYGFTVNPEDASNFALLHAAVEKGYLKIVNELLKCGADVDMLYSPTSKMHYTPLHTAVERRKEEVVKLLLSYGANVNAKDETGKTPTFYAIENKDVKITKLLLNNGANIKDSPELLHIAVEKECKDIVEILLDHDVDVNARDKNGYTALHFTAEKKDMWFMGRNKDKDSYISLKGEIALLLLSKGAFVNAHTKNGMTTLHIATENGQKEVVEAVLKNGAKLKTNSTLLHIAAQKDYPEIVQNLLEFGADVDFRDAYGKTALHIASRKGHIKVVETLLKYGADINIVSKDNRTPLSYAEYGILEFHAQRDRKLYENEYYESEYFDYNYSGPDCEEDDCDCTEVTEILGRQMYKMSAVNLYVRDKSFPSMEEDRYLANSYYEERCDEEIAWMKDKKFGNSNVSFYDILTKDINKLVIYAGNEDIVQVLRSGNYKTDIPIYASMINNHFRTGEIRRELLEQCYKFFHFLFDNFLKLPDLCIENICSYLNDGDLKNLVNLCKPTDIRNPNININDMAMTSKINEMP